MMKTVLLATLALALSASAASRDATLVARTDFDVSARWRLPKFLGKDFHPTLTWWGLAVPGTETDLEVYRECALACPSRRKAAVKGPWRTAYTFEDFYAGVNPKLHDWLMGTNGLDRPLFLEFDGVRREWELEKTYPLADRAGFAAWRAAHPNFYAHRALIEFDCEHFGYPAYFRTCAGEKMRRLEDAYPATFADFARNVNFRDGWVGEAARRAVEYGFGCSDFVTMSYWCPGFQMLMAEAGSRAVCFEATGAASAASWTIGAAYMRGAARLYGRASWWYTANVYGGYTRDGKPHEGENRRLGGPDDMYGRKQGWWGPDNGLSRSLVAWQHVYGWLQGAMFVEPENAHHYHLELAEDGKTQRPSAFAKDFNNLYRLSKRVDRGIPYTPVALLFPIHERLTIQGLPEFHRYMEFSCTAAAFTLVPIRNERKRGVQGSFYNSEFGEFWDITCPDARTADETAAALAPYKAAVLLGIYRGCSPKAALRKYVEAGGTLVVSCENVRKNVVGGDMAGVRFDVLKAVSSGTTLVDENGVRTPLAGAYVFEAGEPTTAKVLWTDEKGVPVAYVNSFGKGCVITIAAAGMLPYGVNEPVNLESESDYLAIVGRIRRGELKFDLLHKIFSRLQAETLPVRVSGDVQWGVNRVGSRWLVWLYNNKGVTHFSGEPESFDLSRTAQVSIDGALSLRDAETGEPVASPVAVRPGRWRLVEARCK